MKRENIIKALLFSIAFFTFTAVSAQGVKDLRFNEIVVTNTDGIENEMGNKCGWIEFYNSGYSTVNLAGCQIVMIDHNNKEHRTIIPRNTAGATIAPQGYLVMFMDPTSDSPLTTNYTLTNAKELYLYDASGKGNYLDKVELLKGNTRDVSLSRILMPRHSKEERKMESKIATRNTKMEMLKNQTPGYSNYPAPTVSRAEKFSAVDKTGGGMTLVAMIVVFSALLILFLSFREVGRFLQRIEKRKEQKKLCPETPCETPAELNGEQLAAIALAVKMYDDEMEHREDMVITINRTARAYSPWSSKLYNLTKLPEVKRNK